MVIEIVVVALGLALALLAAVSTAFRAWGLRSGEALVAPERAEYGEVSRSGVSGRSSCGP